MGYFRFIDAILTEKPVVVYSDGRQARGNTYIADCVEATVAGLHLTAIKAGTWLLPAGIMAFVGGGIGGQLSRRYGPKYVITAGLTIEAIGIWLYVVAFSQSTTFWSALRPLPSPSST